MNHGVVLLRVGVYRPGHTLSMRDREGELTHKLDTQRPGRLYDNTMQKNGFVCRAAEIITSNGMGLVRLVG